MSDGSLRQDIIDELDFEPSIDSADIGVAVEDSVVTLTGHVPTYAQKMTAEEVVRRVKRVKGIVQQIEVRPFGTNTNADDEIAKRALKAISWNTSVPTDAVQVKVQNGWITLSGTVAWQYQKTAAADAVRHLAGVVNVLNVIDVKPHVSASDVKKRIEDALKRNAEVEANAIRVTVSNDKVTLEGKVQAWAERRAAERAAWSAPGVRTVEDLLSVSH